MILIVYVNDIILTANDLKEMEKVKQIIWNEFEIKDRRELKYFGMEIARSEERIVISQQKYTLDLLTETSMSACKPPDTPTQFNSRLEK